MQKITTFLWFDGKAEEAANFYVSVFKNAKILNVARFGEGGPAPAGSVMVVSFELEGRQFQAFNCGPQFKFTEAISFCVSCETQAEIDDYWARLSDGGEPGQCGWLKDKFGLSWQIVPAELGTLMAGDQFGRVVSAMMQMGKLDLAALREAAGRS